jgi:hypothetical protein
MKKMFIAALLALLAGSAHAVDTPTPTFTPTATWTPSPVAVQAQGGSRVMVYPSQVYANNGVVLASAVTTPLPGNTNPWVAQVVSRTAFVMSTGSAKARVQFVLPKDFDRYMTLYAYASTTATVQSITMTINVSKQSFNGSLTNTTGTVVYPGTATAMASVWPGLQSSETKLVRSKLPAADCSACKAGDLVNVDIQRTGGTTTDLYIYAVEAEYNAKLLSKP